MDAYPGFRESGEIWREVKDDAVDCMGQCYTSDE